MLFQFKKAIQPSDICVDIIFGKHFAQHIAFNQFHNNVYVIIHLIAQLSCMLLKNIFGKKYQ